MVIAGVGAAYGTAKSGIGIAGVGTFRPDLIMKARRTLHQYTFNSDPNGYGIDSHSSQLSCPVSLRYMLWSLLFS
jgi:hypothetical protein